MEPSEIEQRVVALEKYMEMMSTLACNMYAELHATKTALLWLLLANSNVPGIRDSVNSGLEHALASMLAECTSPTVLAEFERQIEIFKVATQPPILNMDALLCPTLARDLSSVVTPAFAGRFQE